MTQDFDAVHIGQTEIEQNNVRVTVGDLLQAG